MCLWEDTFVCNNRLCDGFNRPCVVLFSAVDVVEKQSYVKQTIQSAWDQSAKSISFVVRDMRFANNFIISR